MTLKHNESFLVRQCNTIAIHVKIISIQCQCSCSGTLQSGAGEAPFFPAMRLLNASSNHFQGSLPEAFGQMEFFQQVRQGNFVPCHGLYSHSHVSDTDRGQASLSSSHVLHLISLPCH